MLHIEEKIEAVHGLRLMFDEEVLVSSEFKKQIRDIFVSTGPIILH